MLTLLKNKTMQYISPSSFMTWKSCEYKTYITRLAGNPFIKRKTGVAAGIGTVFDILIKEWVAKKINKYREYLDPNTQLTKLNLQGDERRTAISVGKKAAKWYIDKKIPHKLLDRNIEVDVELYKIHGGVPILGILDMVIDDVPFDFKLRGWTSSKIPSLTKGYRWRSTDERPHSSSQELEVVNENWAIQMVFYNWLLGNDLYKYVIHELTPNMCGIHSGVINKVWAKQLFHEVEVMWENLMGQNNYCKINEPFPSHRICNAYNILCEGAPYCKAYQIYVED